MCSRRIGVLALQGAFAEHAIRLRQLGCEVLELRQRADISRSLDGLILPGGESTTQMKLLRDLEMLEPLKELIKEGLPVLGTCAGLILLAESVENSHDIDTIHFTHDAGKIDEPPVEGFRTLPISVQRNGYGRQLGSFTATAPICFDGKTQTIPLTFIRAPRIVSIDPSVKALVTLNEEPVAVRLDNQIGCCFHPELDSSNALYEILLTENSMSA